MLLKACVGKLNVLTQCDASKAKKSPLFQGWLFHQAGGDAGVNRDKSQLATKTQKRLKQSSILLSFSKCNLILALTAAIFSKA